MTTNFKTIRNTTVIILMFFAATTMTYAQQSRTLKTMFDIGGNKCYGFIVANTTFAGFAGRMSVNNTELYITGGNSQLIEALEKQGVPKKYYNEIGSNAYKISKFNLYMKGYVVKGQYAYNRVYSKERFNLQLSHALGDFTTPDFDYGHQNKDDYKGANSWESTGSIVLNNNYYPFEVTEIYFRDLDIRIKN